MALTGCLDPVGGGTQTATPPDEPVDTESATPYPDEMVSFPDGPKERPPLPDAVTATTAEGYAVAHEARFRYNELYEPGADVGVSENSCTVEGTEASGDGYADSLLRTELH